MPVWSWLAEKLKNSKNLLGQNKWIWFNAVKLIWMHYCKSARLYVMIINCVVHMFGGIQHFDIVELHRLDMKITMLC